jgi:hypothetical protein
MTITQIQTEVRALVDADSSSYTDALLLIRENNAYEEIVGELIVLNNPDWDFDDSNFTDLPIGVNDLVDGQQDYAFDDTHLIVQRVEVEDADSIWHLLVPITKIDIDVALTEYAKTDGLPKEYIKSGGSIFLYPAPATASVTLSGGLKVYFQRTASVFTSAEVSTGTKTPGFASPYHVLIAYKAALPYAMSYKKDRVPFIISEINRLHAGLIAHYSRRSKDKDSRLIPMNQDNH